MEIINECAIVLNGNDIIKISNLKRKYSKIKNNANMQILEQCSRDELEEKFLYWKNTSKIRTFNTDDYDDIKKYTFVNPKTGYSIISIYSNLNNIVGSEDYILL